MLHLYDTRTRTAQDISPMDGKTLRFYCCGPTVYGPAHIGNFRTFVMQDVFRRVLELGGVPTTHIRNLTDVDDKTIRDSQKAGVSLAEFTAGWADLFHRDCAALNCLPPHAEPSAVGHIPEQIRMVQTLVEKGHAYVSEDGSVYFRISSFPEYGRLSHLDERELDLGKTANTRSNADEYEKDSVADFVLWKSRRPEDGNNFWPSPWGEGRPGWHLECSAMIHKYFGNDFDLHSGGVDLVFPHHENEVAQSRCACGGGFARLWFHITHLLVDGGKMSKSLG
ncbi:MAG TPA: cysteine--tRNA ligase, partial [Akkermansia muciniphila]|nr:cysteine--tRNA ligase [Akkermansia muciniphila]